MLLRILCLAGCAFGLAFVLALLVPNGDTAHAESVPTAESAPPDLSANGTDGPNHSTLSTDSALWADPSALSATATRRADGDVARSAPARVEADAALERPSAPSGRSAPIEAPASLATITNPVGSLGAGGSSPDAGPSITQLAVLSAALVGVRWLSQRLRASELSWRNALITLSIERPG